MERTLSPEPCANNIYWVMVTDYAHKNPSGLLYHPWAGEAAPFDNLMELLMLLEERMDACGAPQRGREPRLFQPAGEARPFQPAAAPPDQPCLATFRLQMLFRQNASWQGAVTWAEGRKTLPFRSELELLGLMDNALGAGMQRAEYRNAE